MIRSLRHHTRGHNILFKYAKNLGLIPKTSSDIYPHKKILDISKKRIVLSLDSHLDDNSNLSGISEQELLNKLNSFYIPSIYSGFLNLTGNNTLSYGDTKQDSISLYKQTADLVSTTSSVIGRHPKNGMPTVPVTPIGLDWDGSAIFGLVFTPKKKLLPEEKIHFHKSQGHLPGEFVEFEIIRLEKGIKLKGRTYMKPRIIFKTVGSTMFSPLTIDTSSVINTLPSIHIQERWRKMPSLSGLDMMAFPRGIGWKPLVNDIRKSFTEILQKKKYLSVSNIYNKLPEWAQIPESNLVTNDALIAKTYMLQIMEIHLTNVLTPEIQSRIMNISSEYLDSFAAVQSIIYKLCVLSNSSEELKKYLSSLQENSKKDFQIDGLEKYIDDITCPSFQLGKCSGCHFPSLEYSSQLNEMQKLTNRTINNLTLPSGSPLRNTIISPIIPLPWVNKPIISNFRTSIDLFCALIRGGFILGPRSSTTPIELQEIWSASEKDTPPTPILWCLALVPELRLFYTSLVTVFQALWDEEAKYLEMSGLKNIIPTLQNSLMSIEKVLKKYEDLNNKIHKSQILVSSQEKIPKYVSLNNHIELLINDIINMKNDKLPQNNNQKQVKNYKIYEIKIEKNLLKKKTQSITKSEEYSSKTLIRQSDNLIPMVKSKDTISSCNVKSLVMETYKDELLNKKRALNTSSIPYDPKIKPYFVPEPMDNVLANSTSSLGREVLENLDNISTSKSEVIKSVYITSEELYQNSIFMPHSSSRREGNIIKVSIRFFDEKVSASIYSKRSIPAQARYCFEKLLKISYRDQFIIEWYQQHNDVIPPVLYAPKTFVSIKNSYLISTKKQIKKNIQNWSAGYFNLWKKLPENLKISLLPINLNINQNIITNKSIEIYLDLIQQLKDYIPNKSTYVGNKYIININPFMNYRITKYLIPINVPINNIKKKSTKFLNSSSYITRTNKILITNSFRSNIFQYKSFTRQIPKYFKYHKNLKSITSNEIFSINQLKHDSIYSNKLEKLLLRAKNPQNDKKTDSKLINDFFNTRNENSFSNKAINNQLVKQVNIHQTNIKLQNAKKTKFYKNNFQINISRFHDLFLTCQPRAITYFSSSALPNLFPYKEGEEYLANIVLDSLKPQQSDVLYHFWPNDASLTAAIVPSVNYTVVIEPNIAYSRIAASTLYGKQATVLSGSLLQKPCFPKLIEKSIEWLEKESTDKLDFWKKKIVHEIAGSFIEQEKYHKENFISQTKWQDLDYIRDQEFRAFMHNSESAAPILSNNSNEHNITKLNDFNSKKNTNQKINKNLKKDSYNKVSDSDIWNTTKRNSRYLKIAENMKLMDDNTEQDIIPITRVYDESIRIKESKSSGTNILLKDLYRKLALIFHPDTSTEPRNIAEQEFRKISEAYKEATGQGISTIGELKEINKHKNPNRSAEYLLTLSKKIQQKLVDLTKGWYSHYPHESMKLEVITYNELKIKSRTYIFSNTKLSLINRPFIKKSVFHYPQNLKSKPWNSRIKFASVKIYKKNNLMKITKHISNINLLNYHGLGNYRSFDKKLMNIRDIQKCWLQAHQYIEPLNSIDKLPDPPEFSNITIPPPDVVLITIPYDGLITNSHRQYCAAMAVKKVVIISTNFSIQQKEIKAWNMLGYDLANIRPIHTLAHTANMVIIMTFILRRRDTLLRSYALKGTLDLFTLKQLL